jgi:tRNA:m4X modification enzyme
LRNEFGKGNDTDDVLADFGPFEFELMRRWSSGTVIAATSSECSHDSSSNDAITDGVVESTDNNMEKMENNTNQDEQQQQQQQHGNVVVAMDDDDAKDPMNVSYICASLGLSCGPQGLGRACQRLLDQGRCDYLRRVLFCDTDHETCQIEMFHYVPCTVTPQNAVLLAYRVSKTQKNK